MARYENSINKEALEKFKEELESINKGEQEDKVININIPHKSWYEGYYWDELFESKMESECAESYYFVFSSIKHSILFHHYISNILTCNNLISYCIPFHSLSNNHYANQHHFHSNHYISVHDLTSKWYSHLHQFPTTLFKLIFI